MEPYCKYEEEKDADLLETNTTLMDNYRQSPPLKYRRRALAYLVYMDAEHDLTPLIVRAAGNDSTCSWQRAMGTACSDTCSAARHLWGLQRTPAASERICAAPSQAASGWLGAC